MARFFLIEGIAALLFFWVALLKTLIETQKEQLFTPLYGLFCTGMILLLAVVYFQGMMKGRELWGRR